MANSIRTVSILSSFNWFKFAQIFQIFPISIDIQRGKLSYKYSYVAVVIHKTFYIFTCMRAAYLAYAFVRGISTREGSNLASTIFTAIMSSLTLTGIQWSRQLCQVAVDEAIILFNTFDFRHRFTTAPSILNKAGRRGAIKRLMIADSVQELLLQLCPFIVSIFVPMILVLSFVYPTWDVTMASVLPPEYLYTWVHGVIMLFEVNVNLFLQCTILLVLFLELSIVSIHFPAVLATCVQSVEREIR